MVEFNTRQLPPPLQIFFFWSSSPILVFLKVVLKYTPLPHLFLKQTHIDTSVNSLAC